MSICFLCPLRSIFANASACFSLRLRSTLNALLQATMLRIRATNRTIVGYVRCARFPQMQALASLFACGQPEGVHAAGGTASPCRAPEKKTNPIVIGFVFFVSGGDEGGRTPYLLNAIQALYQLSYTPKADNKRKYTIFTSFCQLHLNKWVKCFGTNFFVYLIHSRFARARVART